MVEFCSHGFTVSYPCPACSREKDASHVQASEGVLEAKKRFSRLQDFMSAGNYESAAVVARGLVYVIQAVHEDLSAMAKANRR